MDLEQGKPHEKEELKKLIQKFKLLENKECGKKRQNLMIRFIVACRFYSN